MPYQGGKLTDLVHAMAEVTPLAARSMATTAAAHPGGHTAGAGHGLRPRARLVDGKEVERQRSGGIDRYRTGVESHHYRAPWVEWGTEPHNIEPDDAGAIDTPGTARASPAPGLPGRASSGEGRGRAGPERI